MHPFYGPSAALLSGKASRASGLVSMAAYLGFWAVALVIAKRELDLRFPRDGVRPVGDPALRVLRERFARGEIDGTEFRTMSRVLEGGAPG